MAATVSEAIPPDVSRYFLSQEGADALDSDDFNVEDAINTLIPDETHLPVLPLLQLLLRQRIQECRIASAALRSQLEEVESAAEGQEVEDPEERVARIQDGIGALLTTLATIRSSSTESQSVVESITRDIRSLDLAKANLESAVVGLRRFGMLVNAFDQLTRVSKARRYREAASALMAVKQLSSHLSAWAASVPRVENLFTAVKDAQGSLRAAVMDEFQQALTEGTVRSNKAQLSDACLVVDALGDEARASLIELYTTHLLRDYRRIFSGPLSEAGQLDNLSRRFAWFRRMIKSHEDDPNVGAGLWPVEWDVGKKLAAAWGEVTREDLKSVLARHSKTLNVSLLLESIQMTSAFESEMAQKFGMPYEEIAKLSKSANVGAALPISTVFEPYLSVFVDAQDKALSEMMVSFRQSRPTAAAMLKASNNGEEHPASVLASSTSLFYLYREALDRCAQLSNRSPLLDLCGVFRKWLKVYSEDVLTGSLKPLVTSERRSFEGRRSLEGHGPNVGEVLCACAVLNTADYCTETAGQLQGRVQEKIHPDFRSKVTFEAEQDIFRGNISAAILVLLRELETSCEPALLGMLRAPWKDAEFVSTESGYVSDLVGAIRGVVEMVKSHCEQKKYLRSFCDKAVGLVITKVTQTIVRCRPIPPIGAEQIILDLQALRTCLLSLPQTDPAVPAASSYVRYVTKSVGRLDTILKVVMTSEDPAEDFITHYLVLIPCQSFSDFQKMLDLKGVRRSDQNNLLDLFIARTSTQPDLDETSFLSTVDLDPDRPASTATTPTVIPSSIFSVGGLGGLAAVGGALPLAVASREPSRAPTPHGLPGRTSSVDGVGAGAGAGQMGVGTSVGEGASSKALSDFRRFGQNLRMGLRFSREASSG